MKRILHLISSIQGNESFSKKLGDAIVDEVLKKYPGSMVQEVNLGNPAIPHITPEIIQVMFARGGQVPAEAREAERYSNTAVKQLMDSDIIVIGAPLYNFTIHTTLKSWIDHITRPGITFGYNDKGPVGMVTGKKVYVAMSSGGIYSEGPGQANDFVVPYLKAFLGFLGMTDITVFRAEGLKVPGVKEHALEKGIASIVID